MGGAGARPGAPFTATITESQSIRESAHAMNAPLQPLPGAALPVVSAPIMLLQAGTHHDPFEVLGLHPQPDGRILIRAFLPAAETVELEATGARMVRVAGTDCFELALPPGSAIGAHPLLRWQDKGKGDWHVTQWPYTFDVQLGEVDLHLFGEGRHLEIWKVVGARLKTIDGVDGCRLAVWAL